MINSVTFILKSKRISEEVPLEVTFSSYLTGVPEAMKVFEESPISICRSKTEVTINRDEILNLIVRLSSVSQSMIVKYEDYGLTSNLRSSIVKIHMMIESLVHTYRSSHNKEVIVKAEWSDINEEN